MTTAHRVVGVAVGKGQLAFVLFCKLLHYAKYILFKLCEDNYVSVCPLDELIELELKLTSVQRLFITFVML